MSLKISTQPLEEYMHEKMRESSQSLSHRFADETLWYIGRILVDFCNSQHLFVSNGDESKLPVLAFLYRDACSALSIRERVKILKKLGDTALFVGSLFPENLQRRGLNKDYFIGMGGSAYLSLSQCCPGQSHLYSELASRFPNLMQLIAAACSKELAFDSVDIINLYERWERSHSLLIERQLLNLGVNPQNQSHTRH